MQDESGWYLSGNMEYEVWFVEGEPVTSTVAAKRLPQVKLSLFVTLNGPSFHVQVGDTFDSANWICAMQKTEALGAGNLVIDNHRQSLHSCSQSRTIEAGFRELRSIVSAILA